MKGVTNRVSSAITMIACSGMPVAVSRMTVPRPKVSMCRCEGSCSAPTRSFTPVRLRRDLVSKLRLEKTEKGRATARRPWRPRQTPWVIYNNHRRRTDLGSLLGNGAIMLWSTGSKYELSQRLRRGAAIRLNFAVHANKVETRANVCSQRSFKKRKVAPSTRRSPQFLAALYIHTLMLVILVVFSRNMFSTAIRTVLLALLR
jgi:hypothetical protein